jgi:diaminohydroxyphosphoribosylaminopyrimidine deaminase/5-amino-6-(5-phosphoribosylamino)uracil reductase
VIHHALALARRAQWLCPPNPAVGCVLTDAEGRILGEGHTQHTGGAHAEVMALRDAAARGNPVKGATAYVTLEPCAHVGRTGPCCDALVAAGVARVVASLQDPNPRVAGQGFARLRAAGVAVDVGPGAQEAYEINIGFFSRMTRQRPWVRLKVAASLDGRTALADGRSQWITGEAARADGHAWRARAGAVLTGIGTVLEDDPRLDVRLVNTPRQPGLVVVDSRLQTPAESRLFLQGRRPLIYAAVADAERQATLEARGAEICMVAGALPGPNPKVDLAAMLQDLARRDINELHIEAGEKLNASFLRAGLVDELLVYLAPRLIGPGRAMAALDSLASLDDAMAWRYHSVEQIGEDLRIIARRPGDDSLPSVPLSPEPQSLRK